MDHRHGPTGLPTSTNPVWGTNQIHGQCLGMFLAYQKCYAQADVPERQCESVRGDYVECKTHLREKQRRREIRAHKLAKQQQQPAQQA